MFVWKRKGLFSLFAESYKSGNINYSNSLLSQLSNGSTRLHLKINAPATTAGPQHPFITLLASTSFRALRVARKMVYDQQLNVPAHGLCGKRRPTSTQPLFRPENDLFAAPRLEKIKIWGKETVLRLGL